MSISFPKIRVGKFGGNRKPMDLSHSTSTTADWGFCQPISCHEVYGSSHISCSVATQVQLSPLNAPTRGSMHYNIYPVYVPIADLFPPFEMMQSELPYATTKLTYVPKGVPFIRCCDLTAFLLCQPFSNYTIYKQKSGTTDRYITAAAGDVVTALNAFKTSYPWVDATASFKGDLCTNDHSEYNDVSIEGADYVVKFGSWLFAWRFSRTMKNIRKILIGLGYPLNLNCKDKLNVLPLFAFYRGWFELFAPKQTSNWQSTNAYKILDVIREEGPTYLPLLKQWSMSAGVNDIIFKFFHDDLANCYFTEDPTFISSHISTPSLSQTDTNVPYQLATAMSALGNTVHASETQLPTIGTSTPLTAANLSILQRLTTRLNKQTVMGAMPEKLLRMLFGSEYLGQDKVYTLGAEKVPVRISDVVSNSDTLNAEGTTGQILGARGAQGNANNMSDGSQPRRFEYDSRTSGYFFIITSMVADADFFQGTPKFLKNVDNLDFFHSDYDALGYELTTKDQVLSQQDVILDTGSADSAPFGLIPRYTGAYKTSQSVVNGDISLRSTKDSLMTFTLDKYITPNSIVSKPQSDGSFLIQTDKPSIPIASPQWRFQGLYGWIGNLNRIFVNEGYGPGSMSEGVLLNWAKAEYEPIQDNFMVHHYVQLDVFSDMIQVKDSFDTDAFQDNAIEVEKA